MENRPIEPETALTEHTADHEDEQCLAECVECAAIRADMGVFYSDGLTFTHPDAD